MPHNDTVIDFIRRLQWEHLPQGVRHQSKRCLVDLMGALIAGSRTPVGEQIAVLVRTRFGGDDATVLVAGGRVSAMGAALANGFAANALDIDDGYRKVKGHPGACVLPPVLAAAELAGGCDGREFLTALTVGYEVGIRAGLIRHATAATYHASGSWGAVSGAAAAGRLLGLDAHRLREALGIAEYHAPIAPMMKGIATPCMAKDGIGWGCMVAVSAVLMAEAGFTGIAPLFDDAPQAEWVAGLGRSWEILSVYFKPYAACRWAQPAVDGTLQIVRNHRIEADQIEHIRVRTFAAAAALPNTAPQNTEQAQYSLAFPVAAALLDGHVGPGQVLAPRIADEMLLALARRVTVEIDAECEDAFPARAIAGVTVETRDGRRYSSDRVEARWEPSTGPPTDSELADKFRWLVSPVLGCERTETLLATLWEFDTLKDARALMPLCAR